MIRMRTFPFDVPDNPSQVGLQFAGTPLRPFHLAGMGISAHAGWIDRRFVFEKLPTAQILPVGTFYSCCLFFWGDFLGFMAEICEESGVDCLSSFSKKMCSRGSTYAAVTSDSHGHLLGGWYIRRFLPFSSTCH